MDKGKIQQKFPNLKVQAERFHLNGHRHHRILSTDSKVRTSTLRDSNIHSGSERVKRKDSREIGSLRNDDGDDDGNENGKKAIGLDKENNNFARALRFFVHLIAVFAGLQRETAYCNFTFCRGREQKTTTFFFFS